MGNQSMNKYEALMWANKIVELDMFGAYFLLALVVFISLFVKGLGSESIVKIGAGIFVVYIGIIFYVVWVTP